MGLGKKRHGEFSVTYKRKYFTVGSFSHLTAMQIGRKYVMLDSKKILMESKCISLLVS